MTMVPPKMGLTVLGSGGQPSKPAAALKGISGVIGTIWFDHTR